MAEKKECQSCSRTFSRPQGNHRINDISWELRRFCSPECAAAGYSETARAARPTKVCAICEAEFSAAPSKLVRLTTCGSVECKKAYRAVMAQKVSERKLADYASGVLKSRR